MCFIVACAICVYDTMLGTVRETRHKVERYWTSVRSTKTKLYSKPLTPKKPIGTYRQYLATRLIQNQPILLFNSPLHNTNNKLFDESKGEDDNFTNLVRLRFSKRVKRFLGFSKLVFKLAHPKMHACSFTIKVLSLFAKRTPQFFVIPHVPVFFTPERVETESETL